MEVQYIMAGEISLRVSRSNRDFVESFGGATHNESFTRVVALIDRLYPGTNGIDYLIRLITADIMEDIPDTSDINIEKKKEILAKMREAKTIVSKHERNIAAEAARRRFVGELDA